MAKSTFIYFSPSKKIKEKGQELSLAFFIVSIYSKSDSID
jgi:hypothetical protein